MRASSAGINAVDVWEQPMKESAKFTLAGTLTQIIPSGRQILGLFCNHANFVDVILQALVDGGWVNCRNLANLVVGVKTQNEVALFDVNPTSDGTNLRIRNANAGATTDIIYFYRGS